MDKLEWLKERQKGIGGSDVGAILGVNKWKSAFEIYLDKTEEITEVNEVSEAAYWGTKFEDLVAREFTVRTGKKVRRDNKHLVHKDYPFMVANLDRRVVGEDAILECKTANTFLSKEWEGEEIPASYLLQCQHYLAVTEAKKCYIAVLIGGQKLVIKEIERDEELINMIIEAEKDFWINHVEKRIPPQIDGSEGASRYLSERFKQSDKSLKVNLKSEFEDKINEYLEIKRQIKSLEEDSKAIENTIKNELGNAEKGVISEFLVVWKTMNSNRVDSRKLKDKYPDVYNEVIKQSTCRRFEIKERLINGN